MPRPPRAKVASRVAKPKPAPRKEQAKVTTTTTQTKRPAEASNSFSEDSDGLVTRSKSMRRVARGGASGNVNEVNLTMTGALPTEAEAPIPSSRNRTPASGASRRTRTSRGSVRLSSRIVSPSIALETGTQEPFATAEENAAAEDSSGFGDLTFSSLGPDSPAHGTRPPSAIKVGATPAHERSVLALTNFKRRARQPSLLRMVQQTTDVEDNDHDSLDDTDNFEFDDFLPQAESTPLNLRKNAPGEEVRNDSGTQVSSSGSRGTKRKLSPVVQVPRSSPPLSSASGSDIESERSPSPSLPEILPSREEIVAQTQDDDEPLSETFAPPLSSSPLRERSPLPKSPAQVRPRRRGRPARTAIIDAESEVEDTETPAKTKRGAKKKAEQRISTAQLKGLLPRRRNRPRDRDEFDLDSEEGVTLMDSDQDELQMPTRRNRQRPGAHIQASPKAAKRSTRGKKAAPARPVTKSSRTYSRRISSDKENDTLGQEDEGVTEVSAIEHSEKLAAIRKKFEEVDAFELEFETVDATTNSSPFR